MKLLMQNWGQVLAKSVLLDRIGEDTPDCTESSLKTHVSNLRGKLRDPTAQDCLDAVWGTGFRLNSGSWRFLDLFLDRFLDPFAVS